MDIPVVTTSLKDLGRHSVVYDIRARELVFLRQLRHVLVRAHKLAAAAPRVTLLGMQDPDIELLKADVRRLRDHVDQVLAKQIPAMIALRAAVKGGVTDADIFTNLQAQLDASYGAAP